MFIIFISQSLVTFDSVLVVPVFLSPSTGLMRKLWVSAK